MTTMSEVRSSAEAASVQHDEIVSLYPNYMSEGEEDRDATSASRYGIFKP